MTIRTYTKIRALDVYVQLAEGDDGYIAPGEIMQVVDHPNWTRSKRVYASNGVGASIHTEGDLYTPISRAVSITFGTAFTTTPKTIMLRVYRMKETVTGNGHWKEWDVRYWHESSNWKSTTGFSLTIDPDEDLTGIIIEYEFK